MRVLFVIAAKEFRDGLRNRWVLAATLLLAGLALSLAFVGSGPGGTVGATRLAVTVVSLSSLSIFLVPLIALLLSYDALVGEIERGTMLLLLAYPVARWQVVLGKFLGQGSILAFAVVVGYGVAGLVAGLGAGHSDAESWRAFGAMIGSSILLGAVFLSLGYLISVGVREQGTAAGIAVAVWLVFVVLYDMALLGVLLADESHVITTGAVRALLLVNPADAYRLFNLASREVAAYSGLADLGAQARFGAGVLLPVLAGWVLAPLALAAALFRRREL